MRKCGCSTGFRLSTLLAAMSFAGMAQAGITEQDTPADPMITEGLISNGLGPRGQASRLMGKSGGMCGTSNYSRIFSSHAKSGGELWRTEYGEHYEFFEKNYYKLDKLTAAYPKKEDRDYFQKQIKKYRITKFPKPKADARGMIFTQGSTELVLSPAGFNEGFVKINGIKYYPDYSLSTLEKRVDHVRKFIQEKSKKKMPSPSTTSFNIVNFLIPTAHATTDLEINDLSIVMGILTDIVLIEMGVVERANQNAITEIMKDKMEEKKIENETDNKTALHKIGKTKTVRRIKNLHIVYRKIRARRQACENILNNLDSIKEGKMNDANTLYDSTTIDRFLNLYLYKTTQKDEDAKGFMTWQMRKFLYMNVDLDDSNFSCEKDLKSIFPIQKNSSIESAEMIIHQFLEEGFSEKELAMYNNPCEEIKRFSQCLSTLDSVENRRILERHSRIGHDNLPEYNEHNLHYPGQDR